MRWKVILGPDFIWLHFPKCAGKTTATALRGLHGSNPAYRFDEIDHGRPIWHDSIAERSRRDASFQVGSRRVIANFRRLPYWLLSRVHFEAERPPNRIATREMLLRAQFMERSGGINSADSYIRHYNAPPVDVWVRTEQLADDMAAAFGIDPSVAGAAVGSQARRNATYIKDLAFWFTPRELAGLYAASPVWAELEARLYGSLLA